MPDRSLRQARSHDEEPSNLNNEYESSATVKWYSAIKGYGFVTLADGTGDAYLRASILGKFGRVSVDPDSEMVVRVQPGDRGLQVIEILKLEVSKRREPVPGMITGGTVKWWNVAKGYGFVTPALDHQDIFIHASVLNRCGLDQLVEGQRVSVEFVDGNRGPEATRITLAT